MKKLIVIILLLMGLLFISNSFADVTMNDGFPDEKFRSYVMQFDRNNDGVLNDTELQAVKEINVSGEEISSLSGIEYFTSLEKLFCDNNPTLNQLDLSKNVLLQSLDCRFSPIETIDLRNNTKMTDLYCGGDETKITINVSNCPSLAVIECISSKLNNLDLSHNPNLTALTLAENNLSKLDVSKNTKLYRLWCTQNELTELNVSNCVDLVELTCADNLLSDLDVRKNTELRYIGCPGNKMSSLDVSHNKKLRTLYCEANKLTSLDVSKCANLRDLVNSTDPYESNDRVKHKQWSNADGCILSVDMNVTVITDNVDPEDISNATISKIKDQVYTGKAIKPSFTVYIGETELIMGADYSVSFKNNKAVGKATIKISGKGIYTGTLKTTFMIIPKPTSLLSIKAGKKQITVKWKENKKATGYQIEYSLNDNFENSKKITVSKTKTTKAVIKKLKPGKTYYVRIRTYMTVKGKKYYSPWSDTLQQNVK